MTRSMLTAGIAALLVAGCSGDPTPAEKAPETTTRSGPLFAPKSGPPVKGRVDNGVDGRFDIRPAAPTPEQARGAAIVNEAFRSVPAKDAPAVMSIVSCLSRTDDGAYDPAKRAQRIRTVAADVAAGRRIEGRCGENAPGRMEERLRRDAG